uniref:Putative secreted peptide n=1 Tax=Anopheles braziliensis TaxID=58242 RepID=A0A2M3ZN22_9DIPT
MFPLAANQTTRRATQTRISAVAAAAAAAAAVVTTSSAPPRLTMMSLGSLIKWTSRGVVLVLWRFCVLCCVAAHNGCAPTDVDGS